MSHFTTVKTQLFQTDHLINALKEHSVEGEVFQNAEVRGFMGESKNAEVVYRLKGRSYDIGFVTNKEGFYEAVSDWDMLDKYSSRGKEITAEAFMNEVSRRYAKSVVTEQAQLQGYTIAEVKNEESGAMQMTLRRY